MQTQSHKAYGRPRLSALAKSAALLATALACGAAHAQATDATASTAPSPYSGILSGVGSTLNSWGISPMLNLTQMYLTNPSAGLQTHKHEALTFLTVGADFDMQKIAGLQGGTIHFAELFVPFTTNLGYGGQAGDVLVGDPAPYVPDVYHLQTFTWEQKLLNNKLDIEFGKSNPGYSFAMPVCNVGFGCQSTMLQKNASMNPPPYANWGARVRYDLTPAWSVQAGVWRSNEAFPFTNGWEWTNSNNNDAPTDNTWLANITYRTGYQTDPYPKSYEALLYHSTEMQTDPLTKATHNGTSGMYLGGKQVIYRPDGGVSGASNPTALSVFSSVTAGFDSHASDGLAMIGNVGLTLDAPLQSRPHDAVSLKFSWARLTNSEQQYLQAANVAAGGTGYHVGQTEYALGLDANIQVTRDITLSPFIERTWHANTWNDPSTTATPRNGFAGGILLNVTLDHLLGLSAH